MLEDLPGSELLDEFDVLHHTQRVAEARVLLATVEWAHQNGPDTVDPVLARLLGRQRSVRPGGAGTPKVAEFAAAAMAARLELSPYAGQALLADALDLRYRLPRLGERLQRLEIRAGHARFVARRTRNLSAEQATYVDSRVAESADGRLSWTRFETLVEAAIIAADQAAARAREEEAATKRFAKATKSDEHGMRGFYVRADFATIARIDATVAYLADALVALGDGSSLDERWVKAVLIMANPAHAMQLLRANAAWRAGTEPVDVSTEAEPFRPEDVAAAFARFDLDEAKLLPLVHLFVHGHVGGTVARVVDHRPVTAEWVGATLGPRCRFKITPVLDPLGQIPSMPTRSRPDIDTPSTSCPRPMSSPTPPTRAGPCRSTTPNRSTPPVGLHLASHASATTAR